jgi:hypothetical protein
MGKRHPRRTAGTNYDGILIIDGVGFGEHFVGQTVSPLAILTSWEALQWAAYRCNPAILDRILLGC